MSNEAVWKAKLERADQRIAQLEDQLEKSKMAAQVFANAIVDGANSIDLLERGKVHTFDGVQVLHLLDSIVEKARTKAPETLHEQVLAFHKRFGQAIGEKPHIVDDKTLRFRLSLVAEEFFEMLEAAGYMIYTDERGSVDGDMLTRRTVGVRGPLRVNGEKIDDGERFYRDVDLPALVDALADLDYVIEGFRITMGVDGAPIAAEVHAANMRKLPSYVAEKDATHQGAPTKRADGKILKPEGWVGPDILGQLRKQGYTE